MMGTDLEEQRRRRRGLFGSDAAAYDQGRLGYPPRVLELLTECCGLGPGCRVLEVGAGSGQATGMLLDAGASVVAVELSADLAELLATKHDGESLEVRVGAFEDQEFATGSVDVVASATAFHWVPAQPGLQKSAEALVDGGWLALWWTVYGDPARRDPFHEALQPILERLEPSLLEVPSAGNPSLAALPYGLDTDARIAEVDATHRFGTVAHELIPWVGRHRPEQIRALFATFSPWLALPAKRRGIVLDAVEQLARHEFAGVVERPYLTSIYLAQKL